MKRVLAIIVLVAMVVFVVATGYRFSDESIVSTVSDDLPSVQLKGQTIRVTIVDTEPTREQGLSGRAGLAPDEGMLFIFPEDGKHAIWMKDMLFSIDILWLSADGKVVYMAQNVSPETYPKIFESNTPARYVVELPAGYARAREVSLGDIVRL